MVTVAEVRAVALSLPRTQEHLIRDWVKFRTGRIVYAAVSPDKTIMSFGFPGRRHVAEILTRQSLFRRYRAVSLLELLVGNLSVIGQD